MSTGSISLHRIHDSKGTNSKNFMTSTSPTSPKPKGHKLQLHPTLSFSLMLHDICIRGTDDVSVKCHKCVLVARLEYFRSMLASGWIEVKKYSLTRRCYLHWRYKSEIHVFTGITDKRLGGIDASYTRRHSPSCHQLLVHGRRRSGDLYV